MRESKRSKGSLLMREVNDRIFELLSEVWGLRSERGSGNGEFLCECSDTGCIETIALPLREYAALQKVEDRPPMKLAGHPD
jgi:hypothetical protein